MPANKIKIDNALLKRYKRQAKKHKPKRVECRILIVCEGTKTEPNYFNSFQNKNNGAFINKLTVIGEGVNTIQVVDKAIELRDKSLTPYDRVWAVFDKDSFTDKQFNGAIIKARNNGIECAWSNQAFELWYLYHFQNRITAMHRTEYQKKISKAVNESSLYQSKTVYKYAKNDKKNFEIMNKYGSQDNAIKWAEANSKDFNDEKFAKHNPCTMVFKLVRQLIGKDEDFNKWLVKQMED